MSNGCATDNKMKQLTTTEGAVALKCTNYFGSEPHIFLIVDQRPVLFSHCVSQYTVQKNNKSVKMWTYLAIKVVSK